jgi:hypothetical protein
MLASFPASPRTIAAATFRSLTINDPLAAKRTTMADSLIRVNFDNVSNRDVASIPVTYGVPLVKGRLTKTDNLAIRLPDGKHVPVQTTVLERHADKSVHWLLLDFTLPVKANQKAAFELVEKAVKPGKRVVSSKSDGKRVTVTTPTLTASFSKERFSLFESYKVAGKEMVAPGSDVLITMPSGKRYYGSRAKKLNVQVIESGPQRTVVEVSGRHTSEDDLELFDFRFRYTFRREEPGVKFSYKFTNREEPERGVTIKSIELVLPTTVGADTTKHLRQTNSGAEWWPREISVGENLEIIAGGATNAAAKARYGNAADGKVVIRNLDTLKEDLSSYPYYLRPGNARTDMTGGLRAVFPWTGITSDNAGGIGFIFEMGQNYPKGVRVDGSTFHFDIWPYWSEDLLWRRGMSKEHDLYIALSPKKTSFAELEKIYLDHELPGYGAWSNSGPFVWYTLDIDYIDEAQVLDLHRWLPYQDSKYPVVEMKMGQLGRNASAGGMGMIDYGDAASADRSWCHNNENDAILEGLRSYYRKSYYPNFLGAVIKAKHNATIDFIAHDPDPLRQGTMPAHCPEHTDGATYPSHMWSDGLIAAYCLTGDTDLRDAAISVGENMIRWQKLRPQIFYCDSRECGWPMLAWVRLYDFTGDKKWLDAAYEVFEFFRENINENGEILYELPHGMGLIKTSYGEFVAWRAMFFLWERTQDKKIGDFLAKALRKVYKVTYDQIARGGWACNDLFPAWAGYQVTGDDSFITDNIDIVHHLLTRPANIPWGGVDVMYYFHELHKRGLLEALQKP